MLAKANLNREKANVTNVRFVKSNITEIALPDSTADCIISNCVVNLVPESEKQLAFNEMFRLLKPGGRVAISDMLAKKHLTPEMKQDAALYVGCVAGVSELIQYEGYLHESGFQDVLIVDNKHDLDVYTGRDEATTTAGSSCCGENADRPCCHKSESCCSGEKQEENVIQSFIKKYMHLDLNQWVGKSTMDISFVVGLLINCPGSFQVYAIKPQPK